ncbi:MAG: hypothetical protein KGL39_30780 [Patescibacteria group bacterium]|nr:hypothetical protein [Patescibacteria group bacterium]
MVFSQLMHMTNEELILKTAQARGPAHRAPMAMFCTENKYGKPTGHYFLEDHTTAYARRADEFFALYEECKKRGLSLPDCDCPAGAHDL